MRRFGRWSGIGAFSRIGIWAKYPQSLLNSLWAEIKDLAKADVRTLADATQGRSQPTHTSSTQPTRPSPADSLRITGRLGKPAAAKRGGASSRRRVVTPQPELGRVSIMGPGGLFLREHRRRCRSGLGRPKLGPSR